MVVTHPVRHPGAPAPGSQLPCHYPLCFGCGHEHASGLRMDLFAGAGTTVTGTALITEEHQGAPGLAHGGILAAVMDELLGSLNWMLMSPAVTMKLSTSFIRPVPVGTLLRLEAGIVGIDGTRVKCRGSARLDDADDADGAEAVRAEGLFAQVPVEHFLRHGRAEDVARAEGVSPWDPSTTGPVA